MDTDQKACPYCGGSINAKALKCKHCGQWMDKEDMAMVPTQTSGGNIQTEETEESTAEKVFNAAYDVADIIGSAIPLILLIGTLWLAHSTIPDDNEMARAVYEGVVDSTNDNVSGIAGLLGGDDGEALASLFMMTGAADKGIIESFDRHNDIYVEKHWFWATASIVNDIHPQGTTAAFGIFGIAIPLVGWDDFSLSGTN